MTPRLLLLLLCLALYGQPSADYFVVFLRPDPGRTPLAKEEGERIQAAHMANIQKMARANSMIAAGPFDDTPATISGIFVFKGGTLASVRALAAQDPTVVEHRNTVDVHHWHGPAGLGEEYKRIHAQDPKAPENMQAHPLCILLAGSGWKADHPVLAAHRRYVERLRTEGKLGAAGAMEAPDDLRDLVIFRALTMEEAKALMEADPAVKAGVLRVEYHMWWSADHVLPW